MAPSARGSFNHEGHRLVFDEYGAGPDTVVLLHGLLLNRRMHGPLAEALATGGTRVVCLDLLGHGDSDRPAEMGLYSMPTFGTQVVALLDHLGLDRAVVGGTSLGSNVALEAAIAAPDRLAGAICEMPVLDNALLACALVFTPMLVGLTLGAPGARALGALARRVPRGSSQLADTVLDAVSQDPGPSAAVLQGLFFGRVAPPRAERQSIATRTLIIGHPRDPVHPFSDAGMLLEELADARMLEAESLLELRVAPDRLTREIVNFVQECFALERGGRRGRRAPAAAASA